MDISSMLEVEVQEIADSKENVTPSQKPQPNFPCQAYTKEENEFYKLTYGSDVASVRFLKLHCTGCDEHIGSAPAEAHNMHEHPVLRTLLCAKCREFYGDGTFEQGDDATDMFCRWCANGGNLYCCSYCSNTFCSKCIKRNFDPPTIKRIEAEDSWKCFVCDPKDLFPLRSIARALVAHIGTVTRILENDKRMTPKEIEEKMHLDETKCCSRKRKRRRRRTLSNSDDDEEEDVNYVPELERPDTPPIKRRKIRKDTVRNAYSNGYLEHEYFGSRKKPKSEPDMDPADLMMQCEQSMIEGEGEILNSTEAEDSMTAISPEKKTPKIRIISKNSMQQPLPKLPPKLRPIAPNSSMAINPVPLANLLKVTLQGGSKKIKVSHTPNSKLVAVPVSVMSKAVPSSSITFVKPTTHFLVPKSIAKTKPQESTIPTITVRQQSQPSVIDLDSDDEPVILENNNTVNSRHRGVIVSPNPVEQIALENNVPDQMREQQKELIIDEPMIVSEQKSTRTKIMPSKEESSIITIDGAIPLKIQQRDQRFKKMLILQSQEIDLTLNELKTKILKLVQTSYNKPQDTDLLNSAALCTKRFHRALRKALVELSHINDRVVRDYVHWKKKTDKASIAAKAEQDTESVEVQEKRNTSNCSNQIKNNPKDDLALEMVCIRDSASESESDDDDDRFEKEYSLNATDIPPEFAQILDHLSIFKRKPTGVKAVGDSSVLALDKACQADDVPWKDYEKCIGYSLVTRYDYNLATNEETMHTVAESNENFGKYQEQFLFYLQHIEDHGIETDELKGLPDPNHIPLKDLIDSSSPFITDMLERLSPVALSNGCTSPTPDESALFSKKIDGSSELSLVLNPSSKMENEGAKSPTTTLEAHEEDDKPSEDNAAATSKAVEELQKMVTKLSEDLRSEQSVGKQETENKAQNESDSSKSISHAEAESMDVEILDIRTLSNDDDCTTID